MHDVAWIKPESSGIHLITLIGESKLFQAKIKSQDQEYRSGEWFHRPGKDDYQPALDGIRHAESIGGRVLPRARPADSPTEGDLLVRVRRIEGQAPKTKRSVS